jgi:2-polyprenyl-3-methyl-5-hydroxy-6-metoxy-1,4-benzoquinol methylase
MKIIIKILCFMSLIKLSYARPAIGPERYQSLTGKSIQKDVKNQWDILYGRTGFVYGKKPAQFLVDNFHIIPKGGKVLDIGMGEGRNAVFLAHKKFNVVGIDISSVAIRKAHFLASELKTSITSIEADVNKYSFKKGEYDAILCFYYVDRMLVKKMAEWLKPGGYIFYEGYLIEQKSKSQFNKDPDSYYLQSKELLTLFPQMKVISHMESNGEKEAIASIILSK